MSAKLVEELYQLSRNYEKTGKLPVDLELTDDEKIDLLRCADCLDSYAACNTKYPRVHEYLLEAEVVDIGTVEGSWCMQKGDKGNNIAGDNP